MDESGEEVNAFDAASSGQGGRRRGDVGDRGLQADAAMRAAGVVVLEIPGQDLLQVMPVRTTIN